MWPKSHVKYFPEALPEDVLQAACDDAEALSHTDNFWVPKERILAGPSACSTPAELAICLLYQQIAHHLPEEWQGAEYWVQVYKPGIGLGFHFDKDEQLLKKTGQMSHPIWSSIMYLTGSTGSSSSSSGDSSGDWDGARQAATVILQQYFNQHLGCPVPSQPDRSVMVWPKRNCYCLFDGRLGHGVLNSCSSSRRVTLLINWWKQQPLGVHELQGYQIERLHLTRLSDSIIQHALQYWNKVNSTSSSSNGTLSSSSSSDGSSNLQQQQQRVDYVASGVQGLSLQLNIKNSSSSSCSNRFTGVVVELHAVAAAAAAAARPGSSSNSSGDRQEIVCCKVHANDIDTQGVQMVDAILSANKLTLVGPDAVNIVAFEHPGFVLYPIEPSEAKAAAAQQQTLASNNGSSGSSSSSITTSKLQTLAAFVAQELVGGDDESVSSREE